MTGYPRYKATCNKIRMILCILGGVTGYFSKYIVRLSLQIVLAVFVKKKLKKNVDTAATTGLPAKSHSNGISLAQII